MPEFSDKFSMSHIPALGQLLLYSLLFGLAFWSLKSAVSHFVISRRREKINKLNARISVLKMHLRGKIKRKCSRIEDVLKKDNGAFSNLSPKLKLISDLEFSSAGDYQVLLTNLNLITEEIIAHIHLKLKKSKHLTVEKTIDDVKSEAAPEAETARDICKKLVKYDKAHMVIIVEIVEATDELTEKIFDFNDLTKIVKTQKAMQPQEKIEIEHFELLRNLVEEAKKSAVETPDIPVLENGFFSESA